MKYLHQISRSPSLSIKALFLLLLSSGLASLLQGEINLSDKPGYHCKKKVYLFSEVETARKAACNAFVSIRKRARRPLVHTYDTDIENLIYEWTFPLSISKDSEGKRRENIEKITFNNNCELKDVLYYHRKSQEFKSCIKVPKASTSTNPGINQVPSETSVQCGSLSWEIKEIQRHSSKRLSNFLDSFFEVEDTSHEIDGPWKRTILKKHVIINQVSQNIRYEIIVNNQYEVHAIIVMHYISHKLIAASKANNDINDIVRRKPIHYKNSIRLVCMLDKVFPLFPSKKMSDLVKSRKRKSRD
ncbi:BgTH12-06153 [Blumeria graminis f. sp. triticale]|uniref:BgTH12-06153 n=1 Tax=Blumeria graminis f. sp. triticale TaxID=1689686 RepID=A0A9W4D505_BLUGR|nr:BgTH12-06153 [Blumeria graminis f. sp. triticale]